MYYNQNIGIELKESEYKVFMFNPLIISPEEAIKYLSNCKFVFNKSVIESIKNYFQIYLPKYVCSYINPKSNLTNGCLYFGIGNDGNVSGIPYIGTLSMNFINFQINKIFLKLLKFHDDSLRDEIKSFVSVEIINIAKSKNSFSDSKITNEIYLKYLDELTKIKLEHKLYEKKNNIWKKMADTNILKLCEMINDSDTRKIIWEFIKEKSNYSKKYFKNKYSHLEKYCDVDNYWNLMEKIKSGHKFKPLQPGTIIDIKQDILNIYYWITEWKDSKINMLKLAKPKFPKKIIDVNYPIFLLSQSTKMIPQWLDKNKDLNLFVIKITINVKKQYIIEYKDSKNKWKKSYRTVKNGEPMSLTFK